MPSLIDLDQGGTYRPVERVWMGHTIGWIMAPEAIVQVTTPGTTTLQLGVSVASVNVAGAVTIQLPAFKGNSATTQGTIPGVYVPAVVNVVDSGGNAGSFAITILPAAGETIAGLPFIQITTSYGSFALLPNPVTGGSSIL